MGPFDRWPTAGSGFEHFYGFIGGETNQWDPGALSRAPRRSSRRTDAREGYHFTEDMTDQAIDWIRQQKALMPDKPFFVYFAPGRDARAAPRARRSGSTSTRASSTTAGTRCARRPSRGRRSSASSRRTPS